MRRVLYFGKLLFLGICGLNSLMLTFTLTQANYFKIATKCLADIRMGRNCTSMKFSFGYENPKTEHKINCFLNVTVLEKTPKQLG